MNWKREKLFANKINIQILVIFLQNQIMILFVYQFSHKIKNRKDLYVVRHAKTKLFTRRLSTAKETSQIYSEVEDGSCKLNISKISYVQKRKHPSSSFHLSIMQYFLLGCNKCPMDDVENYSRTTTKSEIGMSI